METQPGAKWNEEGGPRRGVRRFVLGFLAVFLLGGFLGVEAWPLTGWKLYSRVRHGEQWGWQVLAVGVDGHERSVHLQELPAAYHGVTHLLADFEGSSEEAQRATCLALGDAARSQFADVAAVALDHVRFAVRTDPDRPPVPPSRRIRTYQCSLG